ncbi:MAG: DUF3196 family protein [Erysipelotrichaceae bacterium]|nr:DUF3196 family protein [Erysipelotrichaceae bacterium]
MNYYEETLIKIHELISDEEYDEAERIIRNELNVAYVPRDFEKALKEMLSQIKDKIYTPRSLNDEEIERFLFMDGNHQLLAVDALNNKNLREYKDLCRRYLESDGVNEGKALLIESLIRQEINDTFIFERDGIRYEFNPSLILNVDDSDGFKQALKALREYFMKDPSKMKMAEQLLYKEAIMALPLNLEEDEGLYIAEKIEKYIEDAFTANEHDASLS